MPMQMLTQMPMQTPMLMPMQMLTQTPMLMLTQTLMPMLTQMPMRTQMRIPTRLRRLPPNWKRIRVYQTRMELRVTAGFSFLIWSRARLGNTEWTAEAGRREPDRPSTWRLVAMTM